MSQSTTKPSLAPFELDRLVAGELDEAEAARVRALVEGDAEALAYLREREQERDGLMAALSPNVFAAQVADAVTRQPESVSPSRGWSTIWGVRRSWVFGFAGAIATAVVLFAVMPTTPEVDDPGEDVRWMGAGAAVRVHVQREGVVLTDVAPVVGDSVRFEVILPEAQTGFAVVLARVEAETIVVLPEDAAPIAVSETLVLPGSVTLEPGGGLAQLLVYVRSESFDAVQLAAEVNAAYQLGDEPPLGLALELTVDLGP